MRQALLNALRTATRLRPPVEDSYAAQRVAETAIGKMTLPRPNCRVDSYSCSMPDGYRVALRVFTPAEHHREPRGTILFFHGGGWVNGNVDFYADACTTMALKLERRVVSVDYRRAPEYRFPQAVEDCYEVARRLFEGTLLLSADPRTITLCGDSAGGNLAAVVSLLARERKDFAPESQILIYPSTYHDHDPRTSPFNSIRDNGNDYLLTAQQVEDYADLYLPDRTKRANPLFAPLLADDLSEQPRTLVISAELCPLRDEGEAYAARIGLESGNASCYRMLDAVHGYLLYPTVLPIVRDTHRIMKHFLDGDQLTQEGTQTWLEILGTD